MGSSLGHTQTLYAMEQVVPESRGIARTREKHSFHSASARAKFFFPFLRLLGGDSRTKVSQARPHTPTKIPGSNPLALYAFL